jgi:hypothetical protein
MPQSLAEIYTHLVFSTKHREPLLTDDNRAIADSRRGSTVKPVLLMTNQEINGRPSP